MYHSSAATTSHVPPPDRPHILLLFLRYFRTAAAEDVIELSRGWRRDAAAARHGRKARRQIRPGSRSTAVVALGGRQTVAWEYRYRLLRGYRGMAQNLHLSVRLSHFQIAVRNPLPRLRIIQGCENEKCPGIRKYKHITRIFVV